MYVIDVRKAKPTIKQTEPLITSGSLNAFQVQFLFSEDWDGMTKFAVFKAPEKEMSEVLLDESDICDIPWEVLVDPGGKLQVGVYGIKVGGDKEVRLPTIWIRLDEISEGVLYGKYTEKPTPDIYTQFVEALNNIPKPMTAEQLRDILTRGEV